MRCQSSRQTHRYPGFTLVELLVVISILLVVSAMTLSLVNVTITGDKTRGAARQVQSYLEGARGRAVYGGAQRNTGYQCGVRFIPDANNSSLVTSLIYVESQASETQGKVTLGRQDGGPDFGASPPDGYADSEVIRFVRGYGTRWKNLYDQGLLIDGCRMQIPASKSGKWYVIDTTFLAMYPGTGPEVLRVTTACKVDKSSGAYVPFQLNQGGSYAPNPGPDTFTGSGPGNSPYNWGTPNSDDVTDIVAYKPGISFSYQLQLLPVPMPNQEPRQLGNGVVIDLNLSQRLGVLQATPQRMDLMFSPNGNVVGPLSASGILEFTISDREDSLNQIPLPNTVTPNPMPKRDRMIVSLTPQTGKAAVHRIYIDPTGAAQDPFRYAETGEVAPQ